MGQRVHLSKSKLISGWQCPKRQWLEVHSPEEAYCALETEVALAVGQQVGEAAQSLFPEGILIGHDQELSKAIRQTQEALAESGPVTLVDVLDECHELQDEVDALVGGMRAVLSGGEPAITMGSHCTYPFDCPFQRYCAGPQPEMPVYWLPGGATAAEKLMEAGFFDIRDIPEGFLTNELAERCRQVSVSGQYYLDRAAAEELGSLRWPRYYFDFETMAPAVPRYAGTKPYSAQAFQWSCHIEHQDGALEHREFLADGIEAPMRACAESLIAALGEEGPVFMYAAYERRIIRGFIGLFPDLAKPLERIVDRLYDLHSLTKKYYYHPDMHGSWSIKAVLPTVAPDLDYGELGYRE